MPVGLNRHKSALRLVLSKRIDLAFAPFFFAVDTTGRNYLLSGGYFTNIVPLSLGDCCF